MRGRCLCGNVEYEIEGSGYKLYQCHCSLCRMQGGSASNSATIVPSDKLRWIKGAEVVKSWVKDTGFRADFCSNCGAPVPNPTRKLAYHWIPAGSIEAAGDLEIVAHICVSSRAGWDTTIPDHAMQYEDMPPDMLAFIASLQPA